MASAPDFNPFAMVGGEAMGEPGVPVMEPDDQMDDSELVTILRQHEMQAIGYSPGSDDEISSQQERALNYYYRIMDDVPAMEGSSGVVDGTVQVVIDNAMSAILKPFVSSDETVRFTPRGPEDEETADQATEYANYILHCDNAGFVIIHDWVKDALITKLGVIKVWWETENRVEGQQQVEITSDIHAQFLRSQPNYLGEEDGTAFFGQKVEDGKIKIENVPPEEFRLSPFSRSVASAIYAAHVPLNVTRSDVIEMGFDPEIVEGLPALSGNSVDNMIRVTRYQDERIGDEAIGAPHSSQERLALRDEYIRVDYDGDGIAELRRVVRVEDVILLNDEVDQSPFATFCPVPMPHKVYGLSLADLVIELQKISTVLWRQMLDNLYKSNNPRPVVGENALKPDGSTHESLEDNAPGAAILVRDASGFRFDAVPYTAGSSLPMLEMVGNMTEERTGISRSGQGLDSNALRKAGQMTATEMAMIASGKNARIEMMARIFAETGVKQLFKLILGLVGKHQPRERMIRMRGKWVPIDPSGWPDMDLEVSVGLGVGEKSEQIAQADSIIQTMAELVQSPFASMVSPNNAYNAVRRKFTAAGIKNTDEFLTEPQEGGQEQPKPPSPEEMKAQADAQALQAQQAMQMAKLDHERQMGEMKMQMAAQDQQTRQELAQQQAEFEAQLAHAKAVQESQLAEQKMALEARLAEQKLVAEMALNSRRAEHAHEANMAKMDSLSTNRPGGSLSE